LEAVPGPNRIVEALHAGGVIKTIPRLGSTAEDLSGLFSIWNRGSEITAIRKRTIRESVGDLPAKNKTSDHLTRLWVHDEVLRKCSIGTESARDRAVTLASTYGLVTPVTGAVVLENDRQYEQAGLTPKSPSDVPSIPEPEIWAMIIVAVVALLLAALRRQSQWPVFRMT
jgi:hypothetical protein